MEHHAADRTGEVLRYLGHLKRWHATDSSLPEGAIVGSVICPTYLPRATGQFQVNSPNDGPLVEFHLSESQSPDGLMLQSRAWTGLVPPFDCGTPLTGDRPRSPKAVGPISLWGRLRLANWFGSTIDIALDGSSQIHVLRVDERADVPVAVEINYAAFLEARCHLSTWRQALAAGGKVSAEFAPLIALGSGLEALSPLSSSGAQALSTASRALAFITSQPPTKVPSDFLQSLIEPPSAVRWIAIKLRDEMECQIVAECLFGTEGRGALIGVGSLTEAQAFTTLTVPVEVARLRDDGALEQLWSHSTPPSQAQLASIETMLLSDPSRFSG